MTNAVKSAANSAIKRAANRTPARKEMDKDLTVVVKQMGSRIKGALTGFALTPERFTNVMLTAINSNNQLKACNPESFCAAMMQSAQLGLEPNTPLGLAYIIPYGKQAQFQLGYKGMLQLAYRSGNISTIYAETVYENDDFEYELGLEPKLKHKPALSNRGDVIGYYAVYRTKDGSNGFTFMSYEDVQKHGRKFSKTFGNGPWKTDFNSMAKKTVLKQLMKYAPISTDVQRMIETDETVKNIAPERVDEVDILDVPANFDYEIEDAPNVDQTTGEVIDSLAPDPDDPFPEGQQKFA